MQTNDERLPAFPGKDGKLFVQRFGGWQPDELLYDSPDRHDVWTVGEKREDGMIFWPIHTAGIQTELFAAFLESSTLLNGDRLILSAVEGGRKPFHIPEWDEIGHAADVDASRELYAAYICNKCAPPVAVLEGLIDSNPLFATEIAPYLDGVIDRIEPPIRLLRALGPDDEPENLDIQNQPYLHRLAVLKNKLAGAAVRMRRP
jgi:hypothetical protein